MGAIARPQLVHRRWGRLPVARSGPCNDRERCMRSLDCGEVVDRNRNRTFMVTWGLSLTIGGLGASAGPSRELGPPR